MKSLKNLALLLVMITTIVFTSCNQDDDNTVTVSESVSFDLYDVNNSEVMGTISMLNNDSTQVIMIIALTEGTGQSHPAAIYLETANESGAKVVQLNALNGSGVSATTFGALDDGTEITYDSMLEFDGNIKVELSTSDNTIVAMGDIGQNKLTGTTTSYALNEANASGVSGLVIFAERQNGEALVALELDNTSAGNTHPVIMNNGAVGAGGTTAATLNDLNGTYGESRTSLKNLDNGTSVLYNDLINFDGHIEVQTSPSDATRVVEGNIGVNN